MSAKRNVRVLRAGLSHGCGASLGAMALAAILASSSQAQNKDAVGSWDPPEGGYAWELEAMHTIHLSTGKILVWKNPLCGGNAPPPKLWNPADGSFTDVTLGPLMLTVDCAGHAALGDGSILVAGGGCGPANAHRQTAIFHLTGTTLWTTESNMSWNRWYPTCTTLGDGRVLTVAGTDQVDNPPPYEIVDIPEVYDPETKTWLELTNAVRVLGIYAFMFLVPDGTVFYAGPQIHTAELDIQNETWTNVSNSHPLIGTFGSAVMFEPGKVLKAGGTSQPPLYDENLTAWIDLNDPSETGGEWVFVPSMQSERRNHNLVVVADGKILAVGGERFDENLPIPEWVDVMAAEVFDPNEAVPVWTLLAPMEGDPRHHHSTAVLLSDARVLACGGDGTPSAEIFSPPYLFKNGNDDADRPLIGYAPTAVLYDTSFSVLLASGSPVPRDEIEKVTFVRLGSTTHGFDMDQRYLSLAVQTDPARPNGLIVEAPANGNLAPPGYYMLFLISDDGVPSIAKYVRLIPPPSP